MKLSDFDFRKWAYITICVAGTAVIIILLFKYVIWIALPFLLSWALAFPVRQCANFINRKTGISEKVASLVLTAMFIVATFASIFLIIRRLIAEIRELMLYLADNPDVIGNALESIENFIYGIIGKLPFANGGDGEGLENIQKYLSAFVSDGINSFISALPKIIGSVVMSLPDIMFFLIVTVISSFYFCLDLTAINQKILSFLPPKMRDVMSSFKKGVFRTALKYLRSYFILMMIIFAMLLVGFIILHVDYALLLAGIFAVIDLLPVLGVGTMLIPWSIFCLLTKQTGLGIGLIIMYGVITVVRQYAEPKIIGSNFGIHPLLTLVSMYAGVEFLGFFGLIIGPVTVIFIKGIINKKNETIKEK